MKNVLIIFIAILVGLACFFSFIDAHGDYAAERYFWKVNKKHQKLALDTKSIPKAHYDEIEKQYREFISRFPDSNLLPGAYMYLGDLFLLEKEFDQARDIFNQITVDYAKEEEIATLAYFEIARSYIDQDDRQSALAVYHQVREKYPLSPRGLKVPLLMAVLYADNNDANWSNKAFEEAIKYYVDLANKHPNTNVEYNTLYLLLRCYSAKGEWLKTLNIMRDILIKYPSAPYLDEKKASDLIKGINGIALGKLKQGGLAIDIYKQFINKYPDHPLSTTLIKLNASINQTVKSDNKTFLQEK